ncbi:MAG: nucleotidyltransferase [Nitrospirae bacterium RBG_13_39_12]|nr:MAG: nucleotidyltransferase [Nitrospirae bacterium RBG_13_39_12]
MKTLEEIIKIIELNKDELRRKYAVKEIGVFGSFVREEQKIFSDVDILIEPEKPIGLFEFVGLKNYLSDLLEIKVDLVMKRALKPRIGKRILKEVVYV